MEGRIWGPGSAEESAGFPSGGLFSCSSSVLSTSSLSSEAGSSWLFSVMSAIGSGRARNNSAVSVAKSYRCQGHHDCKTFLKARWPDYIYRQKNQHCFACYFLKKNRKYLQQVERTHIEGNIEEFVVGALDVRHNPAFLQNSRKKEWIKLSDAPRTFFYPSTANQLSTKTNPPVVMSCSPAISVLSTQPASKLCFGQTLFYPECSSLSGYFFLI